MKPQRLAVFLDDLTGGGAARVVSILASAWAEAGREITLFTTDDGRLPMAFPLHPAIRHRPLDLRRDSGHALMAAGRNLGRLFKLRRAFAKARPDAIISFLTPNNVMTLLATRGRSRVPILVAERSDPFGRALGFPWESLRRWTYPWADGLITQSDHALAYFPAPVRAKGRVIPNPVPPPEDAAEAPPPHPDARPHRILSLGRLHPVKGQDLLIDAFAALASDFPEWELVIQGEGPERRVLEARVRAFGLEDRIRLPGATRAVRAALDSADLFVLPSRVEGFPNALAEAMACGLPVISFDCPSGPAELIRDGVDGILVPPGDAPALSLAMAGLMGNPEARSRLSRRAPEVCSRFSLDRILALWEEALKAALAQAKG